MNYPLHNMEVKLDFLIFLTNGWLCEQFVSDMHLTQNNISVWWIYNKNTRKNNYILCNVTGFAAVDLYLQYMNMKASQVWKAAKNKMWGTEVVTTKYRHLVCDVK
jgi:hypothetical protein